MWKGANHLAIQEASYIVIFSAVMAEAKQSVAFLQHKWLTSFTH